MNEKLPETQPGGPGTPQDPQAQGSPQEFAEFIAGLPQDPGDLHTAFQAELAKAVAEMAKAKAEGTEVPPELETILNQMTQMTKETSND